MGRVKGGPIGKTYTIQQLKKIVEEISVRSYSFEGESRIRRLVADVYARLPLRVRRKAMEKINFWVLAEAAFPNHLYFPVPPNATVVEATFVVIPGDFLKYDDDKLRTTIAHEIAHVILTKKGEVPGPVTGSPAIHESAADDLCESWGFGRAYSTRQIQEMRSLYRDIERAIEGRN